MQKLADQERAGGTWLWQALSGVGLLILLGLHMIAQHFVAQEGLRSFQDVLAYIRNPVIMVLELLFLLVATYHAMLGARAVLVDLGLTRQQENIVNRILTVVGVILVVWGFYLTWFLATRA
jgi:succinate dehydrogenase / fumarate reductase membrane anchor subunit